MQTLLLGHLKSSDESPDSLYRKHFKYNKCSKMKRLLLSCVSCHSCDQPSSAAVSGCVIDRVPFYWFLLVEMTLGICAAVSGSVSQPSEVDLSGGGAFLCLALQSEKSRRKGGGILFHLLYMGSYVKERKRFTIYHLNKVLLIIHM